MTKAKDLWRSPYIQLAQAAGCSILITSYSSKHILDEPLSELEMAIPPFFALIFETMLKKDASPPFPVRYMIGAVALVTVLVIGYHMI